MPDGSLYPGNTTPISPKRRKFGSNRPATPEFLAAMEFDGCDTAALQAAFWTKDEWRNRTLGHYTTLLFAVSTMSMDHMRMAEMWKVQPEAAQEFFDHLMELSKFYKGVEGILDCALTRALAGQARHTMAEGVRA